MFYAIFNIKKNNVEKCPFKFPVGGGGATFLEKINYGNKKLNIFFVL